jgi:site-specific recombinase XerC
MPCRRWGRWREAGIPEVVPRPEIERLLGSCDRSSVVGARDFAVLMLLARLGLRAVEVSRLELEDLHWRAGEIEVDGKGHQRGRLPLPSDVGEAAVGYLVLRGRSVSRRGGGNAVLSSEAAGGCTRQRP